MIFTVRQLVEKSWEHKSKAFFTFVDLKKAYDSMALWKALRKLDVPVEIVNLIRYFLHQGMEARICLNGTTLDEIQVENGLRHGFCMAPVLFNLYTCLAVERWLDRVDGHVGVGITVKYKRYIRNASERKITECLFADYGDLLASTRSGAEFTALKYQQISRAFGLTVYIPKTKQMATGRMVKSILLWMVEILMW